MFELIVRRPVDSLKWEEMCNSIKEIGKIHGVISVQNIVNVFHLNIENMEDAHKKGWNYEDLCLGGYPTFVDSIDYPGDMLMTLPDPIDITNRKCDHPVCYGRRMGLCNNCDGEKFFSSKEESFDSVHRPAHYAEGRKYEPRKVIADWGLNFNLGNAVKYVARAGRKGDKIEDLRKAIQYIEFEIEELEDQNEQD